MKYKIDLPIFKKLCAQVRAFRGMYPDLNIQAADCFGVAPANSIRTHDWKGCGAGIASMGIDSFGNVMPCLSLRSELRCGNTKEKTIKEIWETSSGFDFNRHFKKEDVKCDCSLCNNLNLCRGGCASLSYSYHNRFHDTPFCYYKHYLMS